MPEISRFYGIVIKMLYEAGGKHNKPHVHVEYGEYEASVGIDGGGSCWGIARKAI